tara:strand:- start:2435 stop:2701 length:267 start_codon:yes stop_codon:yes gene_type:complete
MDKVIISYNEIISTIISGLDLDEGSVNIDTKSQDLVEWDSLGHLTLLMKLDEKFDDITEKIPELASATSVKEIISLIKKSDTKYKLGE